MKTISIMEGVQIVDIFMGISSTLEEGDRNRYELNKLPRDNLSALGTKMYVCVKFDDNFKVGNGIVLNFRYDNFVYSETQGVDKSGNGEIEVFSIDLPYKSTKIKKLGEHTLTILAAKKEVTNGDLTEINWTNEAVVKYNVV